MGDVCTDTPTRTVFATSTSQGSATVLTSTSQSISVGPGSVVTLSVQSGTEWIFSESTAGASTETVQVQVPVTISGEQQIFTVPISTLYAPCTSSTPTSTSSSTSTTPTSTSTSTSSSTSTTPTSTFVETTETPESETSPTSTRRTSRTTSPTPSPENTNANPNTTPTTTRTPTPNPTPTPTPAPQGGNSVSETGTLTTISTFSATTLPNGDQSTVIIFTTSSIAPSGGLNGNDNGGNSSGKSNSNSGRAVAIGVGVAGGFIALLILVFGITWHIRRKRRNAMPLDDSEIWGPHHETKTPPLAVNNLGPGYTYNPYTAGHPAAYAPVPTMSPPRARPMILAETDENRLSVASYGSQPTAVGATAPLLSRAKTADEILYEAAREGLPKSRASSATASHHTRPSETGLSHRHQSYTASHKTHGSLASRTSGSATGLLDHPPPSSAQSSFHNDAQAAQRHVDAPAEPERPMSPVSIAAPRLAIVNPDEDKDL